jgi:heptosyltransferase-2
VKLADIGDVLLCTPAIRAVRARWPDARIDLLTPPSSAAVLRHAPELDETLVFNKFPFDTLGSLFDLKTVWGAARFLAGLAGRRYDAILVFHHYTLRFGALKFAAVALATGARVRAGVDTAGRGWFLTHRVADRGFGAQHEAEYWLDVAAQIGSEARPVDRRPRLPLTEADHAAAAALLADLGLPGSGPLIAVHPGAGWYSLARRWPPAHFAALIERLVQERGADVLLLGGPDEADLAAEVHGKIEAGARARVQNVAGRTSIGSTGALVQRCALFIGNDSGPLHIATAVGTRALAIFGLSNWQAFGPYTPDAAIVRRDLPCQPCLYRGLDLGLREGCGPRPCLTGLRPEAVWQAARALLDGV